MKKLLVVLSAICCLSCEKEDEGQENRTGKLRNYAGLDGCSWVIESNNEVFEPLNLQDFPIDLQEKKDIMFSFKYEPSASICMVGPTIKLLSIKEK